MPPRCHLTAQQTADTRLESLFPGFVFGRCVRTESISVPTGMLLLLLPTLCRSYPRQTLWSMHGTDAFITLLDNPGRFKTVIHGVSESLLTAHNSSQASRP